MTAEERSGHSADSSEAPPERILAELAGAWNRRDWASFSRLFARDADYVTGAGIRLAGRVQIHDAFASPSKAPVPSDLVTLETQSIKRLGPDAAVLLCAWRMRSGKAMQHQDSVARRGLVTIVLARAPEGWRIVSLHNTDSQADDAADSA